MYICHRLNMIGCNMLRNLEKKYLKKEQSQLKKKRKEKKRNRLERKLDKAAAFNQVLETR